MHQKKKKFRKQKNHESTLSTIFILLVNWWSDNHRLTVLFLHVLSKLIPVSLPLTEMHSRYDLAETQAVNILCITTVCVCICWFLENDSGTHIIAFLTQTVAPLTSNCTWMVVYRVPLLIWGFLDLGWIIRRFTQTPTQLFNKHTHYQKTPPASHTHTHTWI